MEEELALIEVELIIDPIDIVLCQKLSRLDQLIVEFRKFAKQFKHEVFDLQEMEKIVMYHRTDKSAQLQFVAMSQAMKNRLTIYVNSLNSLICQLEDADTNLFDCYIKQLSEKISYLAFNATSVNHHVNHELKQYQQYVKDRQTVYSHVQEDIITFKDALIEYDNSL